jgi:prepilin-type N-terminal cleavage/methylation domain-containing protein
MMTVRRICRRPAAAARRGFTLIEAAIVTAIVGIGVVALLQLLAAGSMANIQSSELTTAVFLANNIDEMMQGASYDTLKSTYDDKVYGGSAGSYVKDGRGSDLTSFGGWKQSINVQYVQIDKLSLPVPDGQVEDACKVSVDIFHNNQVIYGTSWIVARP